MTRLRPIAITEQTVTRVFDQLETRTPLSQIARDANLSTRNVERLSTAKRYLDNGTRLELWPRDLQRAWPRLGADLVKWHGSWVSRKDDPRTDVRRRHADTLARLGSTVEESLVLPAPSHFLFWPAYWEPPLKSSLTVNQPRYRFEDDPEFPDLVAHLPDLRGRLETVYRALANYARHFDALKASVVSVWTSKLQELSEGVPREALVGAVIIDALDRTRPPTSSSEVVVGPGDQVGTKNVRVGGRTAPNLRPDVAELAQKTFPWMVEQMMKSAEVRSLESSGAALGTAIDRAKRLVRSESVLRRAIADGNCRTCRRPPRDSAALRGIA